MTFLITPFPIMTINALQILSLTRKSFCVSSTPSAVLSGGEGYPIPSCGGTTSVDGGGVPYRWKGVSHLWRGVLHPWPWYYSVLTWLGYLLHPDLAWVPPLPSWPGWGTCFILIWPGYLPGCGQTENITFPILWMRAVVIDFKMVSIPV